MYFKFREESVLLRNAQLFRRLLSPEKLDPYSAFTRLQPELLELAYAHVERTILQYFTEAIADVENRPLQSALKRLADLFALTHLDKHRAWYLEAGVFTGVKSRAIRAVVLRLCRDVRQEAVALVDAFGIPDACLAAPIAL